MLDYEIPVLVTQAERENLAAKPGPELPSPRFSVVRWTRYGMWTDDGLTVLNEHGQAIYNALQRHQPSAHSATKPRTTPADLELAQIAGKRP